jgi:hypothetical protein
VLEAQLHLAADPKVHGAGGQPFASLLRIREEGPDRLDRPGQQTLEADLGRRDHGREVVVHFRLLFFLEYLATAFSRSSRRNDQKRW